MTSRGSAVAVGAVLVATAIKLYWATTTFGTNDVFFWNLFARGIQQYGPLRIYGHPFLEPYNHMPLTGWLLVLFNGLTHVGPSIGTLVRLTSTLADVVTALLVFSLVRQFRSHGEALFAAAAVSASPLMIVVSGFHGNLDPVFVMMALLSVYLLQVRRKPLLAGVAIAVAVSLKLTPVVMVPWLVFLAYRQGMAGLRRFLGGGAFVFVVAWVPVLLVRFTAFKDSALGYRGISLREWGFSYFITTEGPTWTPIANWFNETGSTLVVLLAMLVPFAVAGWQRERTNWIAVSGFPLSVFLLLSPAFGMQYLTWGLAAAYLLNLRLATLYNVTASVFTVVVYSHWNQAPPWRWDVGSAVAFPGDEVLLMVVTWTTLLVVVVAGRWQPSPDRIPTPQGVAAAIPGESRS